MPYMPYTTNPHLLRLLIEAISLVCKGWGLCQVSRHTGFAPGTISKWMKRAPSHSNHHLPTKSSRTDSHPRLLPRATVRVIVDRAKLFDGIDHSNISAKFTGELLDDTGLHGRIIPSTESLYFL